MRVPSFELFAHWLRSFALLLCGMIIGAAIFMSITHHHLNEQIMKNRALEKEIDKLLEDNESLEFYKNKQTVIKSVSVGVQTSLDPDEKPLTEDITSEIERRVEDDLKKLKGQPISYIDQDPQYIRNIYGAKILADIMDKDYVVEIQTILVIYGELKVWVSAKEFIRQPS